MCDGERQRFSASSHGGNGNVRGHAETGGPQEVDMPDSVMEFDGSEPVRGEEHEEEDDTRPDTPGLDGEPAGEEDTGEDKDDHDAE
jgi:hypothetical protein